LNNFDAVQILYPSVTLQFEERKWNP